MKILDFFKRILSKPVAINPKEEYVNEHSNNTYLTNNPQVNAKAEIEYERIDNAADYEQKMLNAIKVDLAKQNQFLMRDFMNYEHNLTNVNALKEELQSKEKLSDYPESKQEELQTVVRNFVKEHLSEGAGYDKFYGYNASIENYLENKKEIKIGIIDDADQPYIKVTIDKHNGKANFNYIGQYKDLVKPNFKEELNVASIISKFIRPRMVNNNLDLER